MPKTGRALPFIPSPDHVVLTPARTAIPRSRGLIPRTGYPAPIEDDAGRRVRRVAEGFTVLHVSDVQPIIVADGLKWLPLRRTLGVQAFGINAYAAEAVGEDVVERHTEEALGHEEIYIVVGGHATFVLDDERVDAPCGTVVFVADPKVQRHAIAEEAHTTVVAIGGKPGETYAPSAWESYFAVERFREAGEHAPAIAELEEALSRHADHAGILYSLACWHGLAGEDDVALDYLTRAAAIEPRHLAWAETDDDLASIRERLPRDEPAP